MVTREDRLVEPTAEIKDLKKDIGMRLKRIKDDKLYKPRYGSFFKCCRIELSFSKRLIRKILKEAR